jgi:uncharacterized membrane protein YgdD (TMEM256/DUF423 family)
MKAKQEALQRQWGTGHLWLALGALNAALAVALSAVAAHLPLAPGAQAAWVQSALDLHRFHALGLMAVGGIGVWRPQSRLTPWAGALMSLGLVLFCLNLYARAWWGWDTMRATTPWGGMAFIASWGVLGVELLMGRSPGPVH